MSMSDEEGDAGIKFNPEDVELIRDYLMPKIKNEPCGDRGEYIVSKDVYAMEPWLLQHENKDNYFMENEWFYFATRTQVSELKIDRGKKTKRKITGDNDDDRGGWKANDKEIDIKDETGKTIGRKRTLTFKKSNNKKPKLGDNNTSSSSYCVPGSESSWIMKEYWVVDGDKFQKLVLCKIKKKNKSNNKDDGDQEEEQVVESEKDDQVATNPPLACFRQEGDEKVDRPQDDFEPVQAIPAGDEENIDWLLDYTNPPLPCFRQEGEELDRLQDYWEPVPASSSLYAPLMFPEEPVPASSSLYTPLMFPEEPVPAYLSQQQPINEAHHSAYYVF